MVDVGDTAPEFTAPLAGGTAYDDVERFTLSEATEDGPVVLAFFPAAFTSGCTAELCTFQDSLSRFDSLNARIYGVSVDLPFAQNVWMEEEALTIPILSDWNHTIIRQYDVIRDDVYGMFETAERSVFVIDSSREITFKWVRSDGNPDFDDLVTRTRAALEETVRS